MPSLNIQQLLSSLAQQQQSPHPQQSGVDPNIALIMQAMGMMPRQLDMQGRPIIPGQQNPSLMDQHYARQANPQAMQDRYSAPTFAMGPARVDNGKAPIVAHQSVSGLPGQVGPAYSTQMTPINRVPSKDEVASMDYWRQHANDPVVKHGQPVPPWRPTDMSAPRSTGQGPMDMSFGVSSLTAKTTSPSPTPWRPTGDIPYAPSSTITPKQQNPMDVWETQMPPNVPYAPPAQTAPMPAEWQGPPYVNPVGQHLAQLGQKATQQFPALNVFASSVEQKPYVPIDPNGIVWQSLLHKGNNAQSAAQTMFGALAPPKNTIPLKQNPMFQSLVRKGSFR